MMPAGSSISPGGGRRGAGTLLRNPALARTLQAIASDGRTASTVGPRPGRISAYLEREGGYLREADFAAHTSTWVEPLSADYEGHRFLVLPPNTQGITQLQYLKMAKASADWPA